MRDVYLLTVVSKASLNQKFNTFFKVLILLFALLPVLNLPPVLNCSGCDPVHQFQCDSGKCIDKAWVCDVDFDCEGGEDEPPSCKTDPPICRDEDGKFDCRTNYRCINDYRVRNRNKKCCTKFELMKLYLIINWPYFRTFLRANFRFSDQICICKLPETSNLHAKFVRNWLLALLNQLSARICFHNSLKLAFNWTFSFQSTF